MKFPETLLEFQEQFPDEAACWKRRTGARGVYVFCVLAHRESSR